MKRLFYVLTGLEKEPCSVGMDSLIEEMEQQIGFSFEIKNSMRYVRLSDYNLISIMQSHFPDDYTVNLLPIKRLSGILTNLEAELNFDLDYLIDEIKGFSSEKINGTTFIRLLDPDLISIMQKYFPGEDLSVTMLPKKRLFYILPNLERESGFVKEPRFIGLVELIKEAYKDKIKFSKFNLSHEKQIAFEYLPHIYSIGQHVTIRSNQGAKITNIICKSHYVSHKKEEDQKVELNLTIHVEIINSDGCSFIRETEIHQIKSWEGYRKIKELHIIPLSLSEKDTIYEDLVKRGRKFVKYAIGHHYLQHSIIKGKKGRVIVDIQSGSRQLSLDDDDNYDDNDLNNDNVRKDQKDYYDDDYLYRRLEDVSSRVDGISSRVDGISSRIDDISSRINDRTPRHIDDQPRRPRRPCRNDDQPRRNDDQPRENNVKENELSMCAFKLHVYNIAQRKWYYHVDIDLLNEISFDDEAFDKLVLNKTTKDLIESLVTFKFGTDDIVSEKGGGCSLLLYGPPGVGKTLTVEAITERLQRPLFHTDAEELGLTTDGLEKNLKNLFDMSYKWNAIILIDEADIFLERRSVHDINRNILVCVFLRLLEYHQGIIFLTTNRVNCFDDAFQSRISISLEYKELDAEARETLWNTFLDCNNNNNVDNVNIKKLRDKQLSGREIKNVVKLAMALAKKRDQLITTELLEEIIDVTSKSTKENKRINDQDNQPDSKKIKKL